MKQLQTILLALNAAIAIKCTSTTQIGIGVSKGNFHINKVEYLEKGKSAKVTRLHTCKSIDETISYLSTNDIITLF